MPNYYITVPKDKKAEEALDYDNAKEEELIQVVLDSDEYSEYSYIFDKISSECQVDITQYEQEEIVDAKKLEICLFALEQLSATGKTHLFLEKFKTLVKEAIIRETGIYFFF